MAPRGAPRVVLVGDRGMITAARIEQDLKPAGLDWISCLRAPAIQQLVAENRPLLGICIGLQVLFTGTGIERTVD